MKKKILFHLIFTTGIFTNLANSQSSITGEIKDLYGNPLEGVNITITPNNYYTTTNTSGKFTIASIPLGKYKISISHLGFKTLHNSLTINTNKIKLSFALHPDLLNLETIIVTGTFTPRNQIESSTSVSKINSKHLQQITNQGTAHILQNIPGTFVDASAGEVYTKVYTRGVSASAEDDLGWYYVSLQEDGLPVSLIQHSYYSPDLFHRMDITTQKVEAIRGGSASITALNAPGGIFNFISYEGQGKLGGQVQLSGGSQGGNNALYRVDARLSGSLGNHWYFSSGGHYRKDDGARDSNFTFSKGGQFKFNLIKRYKCGYMKFYGKFLNDFTNRWTGVAATNWDNPKPAFGQDFHSTSLLMPQFNGTIPDGRNTSQNVSNGFNPTQGVHAVDLSIGSDILLDVGNNWSIRNNMKYSSKNANWQTSISNAFVSLNNPLAYFISGADFPIGQVVFKEAQSGNELARINNSGILAGEPIQYLSSGTLPYDAIMGTSAWYKDNQANEWIQELTLNKTLEKHRITTGVALGFSSTSSFTQGSFAYVTYEPNPKMLQVTLENPGSPIIQLSDNNGLSNYGGLFYINANAKVNQIATFINDKWDLYKNLYIDLGLRYETITHKGNKDRYAPLSKDGGLDGDPNTAYDNGILTPTGEKDNFNYNYNYLSFSIGLNYNLNKKIALYTRASRGHKAPELNYYFNNFANVPINEKGNIQHINQIEVGTKYNSKHLSFTSSFFWSEVKNIGNANFEFDPESNRIFYTPILFNTSSTIGFEWESIYSPIQSISFLFNGVIQKPKATKWNVYNASGTVDTSDDNIVEHSGNILPFNPKIMFNISNTYQKNNISAFFKWQFMGQRYGNISNGFKLDSYSLFNTGIGYKITSHLSTNLIISNLFNSKGLANFFGANTFGANANGATPDYIKENPEASFVVFPVLRRNALLKLNYSF